MAAVALSGCSVYRPLRIPDRPDLTSSVDDLRVDLTQVRFGPLRRHRFDPTDGFDIDEIATLALVRNRDLELARADAGLAHAQAFAAGLLPDPVLNLSQGHQLGHPEGSTMLYSAGLVYDVQALLTHPAIAAARDADYEKADLNLLWLEWQTVSRAKVLFVKIRSAEQMTALLEHARETFRSRYGRVQTAVARGLITSDVALPTLSALQDIERQIHDLQRQAEQGRHDLNALVAVAPEARLELVGGDRPLPVDGRATRRMLDALLGRRPDILALRKGLEAEDDRYRAALLAQFPSFVFGPQRGRDNTDANVFSLSVGITLPVFNRNRGNVAVELASRAKLLAEYRQRIAASASEVGRLLDEQDLSTRQVSEVDTAIDELSKVDDRASQALRVQAVDALTLTNVETALLNKRMEALVLEQTIDERRIALQTLVSSDLPTLSDSRS